MRLFKPLIIFLLFLGSCFPAFAQAPIITPKSPADLPLDNTGKYNVSLNDIASVINNTDSALKVSFSPKTFDCSTIGAQTVTVSAQTNGSIGPLTPQAVNISGPYGLAFDKAGNLYVAENHGLYIKKITPDGAVTILAGTGQKGNTDGPGASASFGVLLGIALDDAGNVYVSDADNGSVRKITPAGVVSTLVKNIVKPQGLVIDSKQNLFIVDEGAHEIIKVPAQGNPSTIAGDGTIEFADPLGITVDAIDNVYVGDAGKKQIYKISPSGIVSVYAGSGTDGNADGNAASASFSEPYALKADASGNIYVADAYSVRRINPAGMVSTVAGSTVYGQADGPVSVAQFTPITSVAIDPCNNIYVSDFDSNRIRKITQSGTVSTIAGGSVNAAETGNIGASSCAQSSAQIPVNVLSTPTITPISNITINNCSSLPDYTLIAVTGDNCPSSIVTVSQSPAAGSFLPNNVPITVTLTATDNTGGTASMSFTVTANYTGTPSNTSVNVSTATTSICKGDVAVFNANVINAPANISYQWLVNGADAGTNSAQFTSSTLNDGDLVSCAVTSAGGCDIPNTGPGIFMQVSPLPTITLNPTEQIVIGKSVTLNPTVTVNVVSYSWTPTTGLSNAHSQYPVASPKETITYQLMVTTNAGCQATANVTVQIITQLIIPNTFTPNGDGFNDYWDIKYLSDYTNSTVNVYNRYGQLVYKSIGYATPWAGTYNGSAIPGGVYYYVIDLKDGKKPLSGHVTVLR